MERIVYVFRALASRPRMRILRSLVAENERTVSAIEGWTGLAMNSLCSHLRVLASAGLVWRRRSGGSVYYRLAEKPSSPATVAALVVVRGAFAGRGSAQMSRRRQEELDGIEGELFAAFTAFTHPRRLGILRYLDARGETEAEVLSEALSMSPAATTRHLSKLSRRGLVVAQTGQGRTVYVLAGEAPATASELLRAVLAAMGDRSI